MGQIINTMINIKQAQKNHAASQLDQQLRAAHAGFPIDPKAVEKTAKKAGLPLPTDEGTLKGMTQPQGEQNTPTPGHGTQPQGGKQEDPNTQAFNPSAIKDVKERQKAETGLAVDGMIRQAVTNAQLRGHNQQQILEYTGHLQQLKDQALSGDPRALGQLATAGQLKMDVPTAVWQGYSPQQKAQYLEVQRGGETDSEKFGRVQAAATNLLSQGYATDPQTAYQAAAALADGKGLPADVAAKIRPTSLMDLTKEVDIADKFAEMGFSGDQIAGMARGAGMTGFANYLPKGMVTLQQQMMGVRQTEAKASMTSAGASAMNAQTGRIDAQGYTDKSGKKIPGRLETEANRVEAEKGESQARMLAAQNTAARIEKAMKTDADKAFLANFTAMVDLARAGKTKIDPGLYNYMEQQLVSRTGGEVSIEDSRSFMNYLTFGAFGTSQKMVVAPKKAGEPTTTTEPIPDDQSADPAAAAAGVPQ
jgi:hypothetical protein